MKFGYARCSTLDQNLDWQIDTLMKEGCDRILQEKFTGPGKDRPELLRMLDMLREGNIDDHSWTTGRDDYLPFPQNEIDVNKKLQQNPGY